jgi:DNA ligase-1
MIKKPMLAANDSPDVLKMSYPCIGSYKTDGIRCLLHDELGPVARSFKRIPNTHIWGGLHLAMTEENVTGLDGELVTYTDGVLDDFHTIQSKVMKVDGEHDWALLVFDDFTSPDDAFIKRIQSAEVKVTWANNPNIKYVPHYTVKSPMDLEIMKQAHLDDGHEGTMTRDADAPYKEGRSTLKQEWLLKHKVWKHAEGTIIGYEELMENHNEQYTNELGNQVRSSKASGKRPAGTLGAIVLHTDWGTLNIGQGKGLDRTLRDKLWGEREQNLGAIVTFKYMPYGMKPGGLPRLPGWVGIRSPIDMSD